MAANEPQIDAINSYSTKITQRDPNSQAISSVNIQYRVPDDNINNYNRADRTRTKKVYRIKNPFQNQFEEINQQNEGNVDHQDSGTAASNQYASMQYSLPPEEFLQQMRENQYHQQQQQQPQTTPAPNLGYTATPLPQYQYSTITSGGFDNTNQQSNPITQLEPKPHAQYLTSNGYQFSPQNTFSFDSVQSTPSPATNYLSTALPNSQYGSGPSSYVSSSSPIFLSSPSNLQYVSSPLSPIQTGSSDYSGNRVTTTVGSNSLNYDNDQSQKLQIDHYDNSANGIRYPVNVQQQYQNEYGSSTLSPTSVSYSDSRDYWQNNINSNALSKSLQEVSFTQYQNYPYNQHDARSDTTLDANSETHRIGSLPSANNLFLNYAQPDYQSYSNVKARTRDTEQETGQAEYYTNGDYGWKLSDRKPQISNEGYSTASSASYQRYQPSQLPNTGQAMSQMTFHMDTSRPSNYEQVSKSATDSTEAQEFAKAAASAHEYMKQQQQSYYGTNFANNYNNNQGTSYNANPYYSIDKQKNKYTEVSTPAPYVYSSQPDLITASPYYYNSRENNIENKPKQPFDHAKALKAIVPIDVSNVIPNTDSQLKGLDVNRYNLQNYAKDQINQNQLQQAQLQQQYRPISDTYYKDKNAFYGINIKTKQDEYSTDNIKQLDTNTPYYTKPQQSPESIHQSYSSGPQRIGYNTQQSFQDSIQSSANIQQQRPQVQVPTDINSILKLNDVPYQLTHNHSPESFRFQNSEFDHGSLPTQLPIRINQDVASHQLDVTSNILNKLLMNKHSGIPFSRPDFESQALNGLSTINGFKVANPFNVDLKLVAEMLKGKTPDNMNILALRDQFNKQAPLKFDLAQLQYLLKNDNIGNLSPLNDGLSALSSPFLEVYNSGRYPYQGVKYSRSQEEEEETIVPIADASNHHPIGAVAEQDDSNHDRDANTGSDTTAQDDESIATNFEKDRAKKTYSTGQRIVRDRHRHPNSLTSGRNSYQKTYPKAEVEEPYPLLKPPPPHTIRGRGSHLKPEKQFQRRRVNKPRVYKIFKTEPLFEAENANTEDSVPTLLRPPPPVAESKSDNVENSDAT